MSKKAVMMKLNIPKTMILAIMEEGNRRIKQELRIRNIDTDSPGFKWSNWLQDEEAVRNAFVNVITLPMKEDQKKFNPVQVRNYNRLLDSLVTQICDEESEEVIIDADEWKLIKPYWEHDGEKAFHTAVLDGVVIEYFHSEIFNKAKKISKEELELKTKETEDKG